MVKPCDEAVVFAWTGDTFCLDRLKWWVRAGKGFPQRSTRHSEPLVDTTLEMRRKIEPNSACATGELSCACLSVILFDLALVGDGRGGSNTLSVPGI